MDRFRKFVETVRSKWREFVLRNWHNQPEGDYFRLFDDVLLIGAICPGELTKKWQTNCWKLYRLLTPFHNIIFMINLIENLSGETVFRDKVWHVTVFASANLIFAMQIILNRFNEEIQAARGFINSKPSESGDKFYDAAVRKKFFQRTHLTMGVVLLLGILDQVIMFYPSSGIDKLFVTPQSIHSLGPRAANGTQFMLTSWIFSLWFCKRFAATIIMCSLLVAFKMELNIFTRGFNKILDRVEEDVEENLPTSSTAVEDPDLKEVRRAQRDNMYWKHLNQRVTENVKKHIDLLENLQSLQPVIKWLFGAIYYYTLALVSPIIYTTLLEGISFFSVALVTMIGCLFLEGYWWCSEIESLQDENDDLEVAIMDLMANIPYTMEHQDDYVGMQKTLMIMKIYVRNSGHFSCGGVFDITVEEFRNLLDVSYSVLTFLIDMGKLMQRKKSATMHN